MRRTLNYTALLQAKIKLRRGEGVAYVMIRSAPVNKRIVFFSTKVELDQSSTDSKPGAKRRLHLRLHSSVRATRSKVDGRYNLFAFALRRLLAPHIQLTSRPSHPS
ncbi:hypothetical protein LshimejAT787_1303180 [Lyophyllum shimeji]|uniref:Uncharacterized protein n=1 Tax=Lyophyllum shimeji TaxID=47721 RepID=A0A9P3PUZ2_LYOSH|nr:hypothetical protein LshimejAT787_1303180 [Lyophyllum shimeji]